MCYFIAIAVPGNAVERVCTGHAARGMHVAPTSNASARAAAGPGRAPLLVTTGCCSCDWYRPPPDSNSNAESRIAKARARYERMGWSKAKIERALAGRSRLPRHDFGLHPTVIDLLAAVARDCGSVAVWVHDFAGDTEGESYAIARRENWKLEDLSTRASTLAIDTLVEIGAESGSARV